MLFTHHFQNLQVSHAMNTPQLQHACCTTGQPFLEMVFRRQGGAASLQAL